MGGVAYLYVGERAHTDGCGLENSPWPRASRLRGDGWGTNCLGELNFPLLWELKIPPFSFVDRFVRVQVMQLRPFLEAHMSFL